MKKVVLISGILLTFIIGVYFYSDNENCVLESGNTSKQLINSNALTMMYETEAGSGEYQVSNDTTWPQDGYAFNETLSKCENGGILTWDNENKKVLLLANTSDKCYVYFDVSPTLADYIINNVYTGIDGDNDLYYHDGVGSYANANLEAGDNSYRYSGANPNNYVCFGSDEEMCSEDNLYRIIGVFDGHIKLIKSTAATISQLGKNGEYSNSNLYKYSSLTDCNLSKNEVNNIMLSNINNSGIIAAPEPVATVCNNWEESNLNLINLNTNYFNSLSPIWQSKISDHSWCTDGTDMNGMGGYTGNSKVLFEDELINCQNLYVAKIGLMYASDYGFSRNSTYWSNNFIDGSDNDITWMYISDNEWTITEESNEHTENSSSYNNSTNYMIVNNPTWNINGALPNKQSVYSVTSLSTAVVRPVFYINSDVQYLSGTGTQSDPFRIA